MAFIDDIRKQFGVKAPQSTTVTAHELTRTGLGFSEGIERALRIGQGETFNPVDEGTSTGLQQLISGASEEQDFLRGIFKGADIPGIKNLFLGDVRGPQGLVEPNVPERSADNPGDLIDSLQEGAGRFLPLILGSGLAGAVVTPSAGSFSALGGETAVSIESVVAGGLKESGGFFLTENILTGMEADMALGQNVGEGIMFSAMGTAAFKGLGASFRATGKLPQFALEQASELQKNIKLRSLARNKVDPRATDLTNQMIGAGKAIDDVTGGVTQVEQEINDAIWNTVNPRKDIQTLINSQKQFTDEVLDQRNLTEILHTRTDGDVRAKLTSTGDLETLARTTDALEAIGMKEFGILDRVSPTASLSERLAVMNGNEEVFLEVSRRMGTPEDIIEGVMSSRLAAGVGEPGAQGKRLLVSLQEQAQLGQLQGRLDVVSPNFNGVDTLAQSFTDLPTGVQRDMSDLLTAMGLNHADRSFAENMVKFEQRMVDFYAKESEGFIPRLPLQNVQEGDVLRAVARTQPSNAAARRARDPQVGGPSTQFPHTSGDLGIPPQAGVAPDTAVATRILANSVPLPMDAVEAAAVRQTLFNIADAFFESRPGLALQAVHTLKNFDAARKVFAEEIEGMGRALNDLGGPLGAFARQRFNIDTGEFIGTRMLLSEAMDASAAHYPELNADITRMIFGGSRGKSTAVVLPRPHIKTRGKLKGLSSEAQVRSFRSTVRHEFGHEVERALKNSSSLHDNAIAAQIRLASFRQPYRNDDFSFREMTGKAMGPGNAWAKPHGVPEREAVAELISNLMTPQGRAHIHPNARDVLEGVGIVIQEAYAPNRPAFQFGHGNLRPGISRITGEVSTTAADKTPSIADIGKALGAKFPGKGPSAKQAGNSAVGPTKLNAQQQEVSTNAIAALSRVGNVNVGPEKQIGLFTKLADEGLHIIKPSKAVQELLVKRLGSLGSNALQTFNESLITLPRNAQAKFVARFIEDGEKVLGASFLDYTRAVREWRASAMLFGPSTWAANFLSTGLNSALRPLIALTSSGIDATRSAITGSKRVRFAEDSISQFAGILSATRDAVNLFKHEISAGKLAAPVGNPMQDLFKSGSVMRGTLARESALQGSDVTFLMSKNKRTRAFAGATGKGVQVPFQMLRISDNAMFNMNFTGEMYRLAAIELRKTGQDFSLAKVAMMVEGRAKQSAQMRKTAAAFAETELEKNFNEGFKASDGSMPVPIKALKEEMIQKAMLDNVPEDMKQAKLIAERTIFIARETGQLDKLLSAIDQNEVARLAFDIAVPFRRTPMNIVREGIRTSPLGFLIAGSETIGAIVGSTPKNAGELVDAYAQATVGTLLYSAMTAMALYGIIEGNPTHFEQNRAIRTTMLADGRLPETVFIMGHSIPLSRLQPVGGLVLGALRSAEVIKDEGLKTLRPDILFGTQLTFIKSLGLQDQLEGTADLIEAVAGDDPRLNFSERFGGSFVPAFIRQGRQALGIEQGRSAKATEANALTRFAQGVRSGATNSGLSKLGLFGETIKRTPGLGAAGVATIGQDPVISALIDAGSFHQAPDVVPELRDSNASIQHAFIRGKGQLQKQFVQRAMETIPNFAQLPQERRKRIIDAAFTRGSALANKRAKNALRAGAVITPKLIISGKLGL